MSDKKTFINWALNNVGMNTRHTIKRLFHKLIILYRRKAEEDGSIPRSRYEKEAVSICRNMVMNQESKLTLNVNQYGLVNERYVENEKLDITIFIYENSVDIIRNDITREIVTSPKTHDKIINIFDGHVRERRDMKKELINSKLKDTLEAMVEETKKALNKTKK